MLEEYIRTVAFYNELKKIAAIAKIRTARQMRQAAKTMQTGEASRLRDLSRLEKTLQRERELKRLQRKQKTTVVKTLTPRQATKAELSKVKKPLVTKKKSIRPLLGYGATAVGAGGAGIYGGYKYNKRKRASVY